MREHKEEILKLARRQEELEKGEHPLNRITLKAEAKGIGARLDTQATASKGPAMKLDLRQEFLKALQVQYLDALDQEERAVIEVSLGEMGNKPDAVKLGWR